MPPPFTYPFFGLSYGWDALRPLLISALDAALTDFDLTFMPSNL